MEFRLKNTGLDILKALAYIIDVEEQRKLYHSWRVAYMSKCLAENVSKESVLPVYIAGLLHDVGAFDLSDRLVHMRDQMQNLNNPDVRTHPQKGSAIVASLPGFVPIGKIILDHHEWINGKGYPRGLTKEQISIEAQIIKICDKFSLYADIIPCKTTDDLHHNLKANIDKEFSKDLYYCLLDELNRDDKWESVVNPDKLIAINDNLFEQLPVEEDDGVIVNRNLLHFFGRVLDAKHSYTEGHSQRVSYFSVLIAIALDLPEETINNLELAAYLHDIGKVGIPNRILDKKGALTPEEFEIIKSHASLSYEIVKGISVFEKLSNIVGADQEHWDGSGYPDGLKKEEIPIEARIIFVADAFDAMTSNRSYRKAMPVKEALKELSKHAGTDFDPDIVHTACALLEGFENSSVVASYND